RVRGERRPPRPRQGLRRTLRSGALPGLAANIRSVATWNDVRKAAPDLSAAVQRRFDAHIHKTLATLRADGSPRISGQEASFRDGELWLGMMPDSRKAQDLLRDPRLALHSATVDPDMAGGDAKLSGQAAEVTDEETFDWFVGQEREEKGEEPPSRSISSGSRS